MTSFEFEPKPALGIPRSTGVPLAALITFSTAAFVIVMAVLSRDKKILG